LLWDASFSVLLATVTLGEIDLLFRVERASGEAQQGSELLPQATRALLRPPLAKLASDVRLLDTGARAQTRLRILSEVARQLPSSEDIETLLRKIVELVFQLLDVDRGAILLVESRPDGLSHAPPACRQVPETPELTSVPAAGGEPPPLAARLPPASWPRKDEGRGPEDFSQDSAPF
jgi:hypothetical protein